MILARKGMYEKLSHWKNRNKDRMNDVYEGRVWQDNLQFFQQNGIGLMMNIDWFKPFGSFKYSIGAIYLVIMNLPREERFKEENMIIAGLIPGKKEPNCYQMDNILKILIQELNSLERHNLFTIKNESSQNISLFCKVRLLCVACDIPAARKVCGFLSHNATHGCSKCHKEFPRRVGTIF